MRSAGSFGENHEIGVDDTNDAIGSGRCGMGGAGIISVSVLNLSFSSASVLERLRRGLFRRLALRLALGLAVAGDVVLVFVEDDLVDLLPVSCARAGY